MGVEKDEGGGGSVWVGKERISGLDSLRLTAALWVLFSHLGPPPVFMELDKAQLAGFLVHGLRGILFSGPAAVIVFFVISGFCIHHPYASGAPFHALPYLARRYVRIGIPMVAAMAFTRIIGMDSLGFFDAILWSLVAELMYYTLYPLFRRLLARFGIDAIVLGSYVLSIAVVLTDVSAKGYGVYGWELNWILGLPCWLLGVKLAEEWQSRAVRMQFGAEKRNIWKWRILVWMLSSVCLTLNFHSPVGYPWTLNLFALSAYLWIAQEMRRGNDQQRRPWRLLEWGGQWSYSIYLCHMLAAKTYDSLGMSGALGKFEDWSIKMVFVLVTSYAFYQLIEHPAHLLARRAGKVPWLSRMRA